MGGILGAQIWATTMLVDWLLNLAIWHDQPQLTTQHFAKKNRLLPLTGNVYVCFRIRVFFSVDFPKHPLDLPPKCRDLVLHGDRRLLDPVPRHKSPGTAVRAARWRTGKQFFWPRQVILVFGFQNFLVVCGVALHFWFRKDEFFVGNMRKIKRLRTMDFKEFFQGFKTIYGVASSVMFGYMMNFVNVPGVMFSSRVSFFYNFISRGIHSGL